jgi:hypothetical protein
MDHIPVPPRKTLNKRSSEAVQNQADDQQVIMRAFDRVAKTEDGLFVLQKIFQESGVNTSHLILTAAVEISEKILLVKQGRAGLWLDLRKNFSRETLIAIEYPETKGNKK